MRMVAHKPNAITLDRPGEHWRPGVHWGPVIGGATTVRIFLHPGEQRDYVVAVTALNGVPIGAPIVARFTSDAYSPVAEVQAGEWPGGSGPGGCEGERDAVAAGRFYVGIIPRWITGEGEEHSWTMGGQ